MILKKHENLPDDDKRKKPSFSRCFPRSFGIAVTFKNPRFFSLEEMATKASRYKSINSDCLCVRLHI